MQFSYNVSRDYLYVEFMPETDEYFDIQVIRTDDIEYGLTDNGIFYLEVRNLSKNLEEVKKILRKYAKELPINIVDKTLDIDANDNSNSNG